MTTTTRRAELGVLAVLLLLAAFAVWQAASMPAGTPALPGPGMLPMVLGTLLGIAALALLPPCLRPAPQRDAPIVYANRHIALAVLSLIGAGLLLEPAGFVPAATLYLFAMLWMLSPLGWWRSLAAAAVAAAVTKYLFADLLGVALPPIPWGA